MPPPSAPSFAEVAQHLRQERRAQLAVSQARESQALASRFFFQQQAEKKRARVEEEEEEESPMQTFLANTPRPAIAITDAGSTYTLEWPALDGSDDAEADPEGFSCLRLRSWTLNLCFDRPVEARMFEDEPCPVEEAAAALLAQLAELPRRSAWRFRTKGNAGWWLRVTLPRNTVHIRFEPAIAPAVPMPDRVRPLLVFVRRLLAFWRAQRAALAENEGLFMATTRLELHSRRREDDWLAGEIEGDEAFVRHLLAVARPTERPASACPGLPPWVVARIGRRTTYL